MEPVFLVLGTYVLVGLLVFIGAIAYQIQDSNEVDMDLTFFISMLWPATLLGGLAIFIGQWLGTKLRHRKHTKDSTKVRYRGKGL